MPERRDDLPGEDEEIAALLRLVDHPVPHVSADAIAARARTRELHWVRWAAGVLVAAGLSSAAWAVPGSPVRGWVRRAAEWIAGARAPAPPEPAPRATETGLAGIAVAPGERLVIAFTTVQAAGEAVVELADDADVVVRAPGGAATFASRVDQLTIDNRGSTATFAIAIPRAAPFVEIRVAGAWVLRKRGARILLTSGAGGATPYHIALTR